MKIKYSKFDFNGKDIAIFIFFVLYGAPFLYFYSENTDEFIANFMFSNITLIYFFYRFYYIWLLKKKMNIEIENGILKIFNKNYNKTIHISDIKKIIIRKNFLNSYDIMINFDETISLFRYFCNYLLDVSIGKNHTKSYVICDVKNKDEVLEKLLTELNIEENIEEKNEKLYVNYSLLIRNHLLFLFIFLLLILVQIIIEIKIFILVYMLIINIKILKKEYKLIRIDSKKIKIYEKNKSIYVIDEFIENENNLKINYNSKYIGSKYNFYYFLYNVLPKNYKK